VRLAFNVSRLDGSEFPVEIALAVTDSAIRRGANVDFYIQREYCGECGGETQEEDARSFYETGVLEPLEQLAEACRQWGEGSIVLRRPFHREIGHAYTTSVPEAAELADRADPESARRFFCARTMCFFAIGTAFTT
jgi:hypothetical protein